MQSITVEIGTNTRRFVRAVGAIVSTVADIRCTDAEVIVTLELRLRTISSPGILRRAIHLVRHVSTIPISVATEVRGDTMPGGALERAVLTLEAGTTHLVRIVQAVVLVIATPSHRNTFTVAAVELGFGTFAVFAFADGSRFVGVIAAIVSEVAHPLFGDATVVGAFEFCVCVATWTVLREFVGTVAAVVFAVAEEPFRYTPGQNNEK